MRASAIRGKGAASFEDLKPVCQILVLHEDFAAYSKAVDICRRVMERYADLMDFNVKCWNFIELADPNCARHAVKSAGTADILLLAMRVPEPQAELDRWLEFFSTTRSKKDGLIGLIVEDLESPAALKKLASRLELLAARMDMDFLAMPPGNEELLINVVPASVSARAT